MKQLNGVWLPDHEEHLKAYADKGPFGEWTYQKNKLDAAMKYVGKKDVAIDVGGHCGIWARELTKLFGWVHSFEPVAEHRACYQANQRRDNFNLYPYALGERDGKAGFHTREGSSGDTWLVPGGCVDIKTLDWFDLSPNLLKIDTEGYELFVLRGAEKTLVKHRPVVIVEQKPGHASKNFGLKDTAAIPYLESLGYKLREEISGDFILT